MDGISFGMDVANVALQASQSTTSAGESYQDIVKRLFPTPQHQTQDAAVEQFKKDLSTKGAATYLADLNKEKIEALVDEYRQKLLKEQAKDPSKKMNIAKMVSDYKEQLLKELEEARKAEQLQKNLAKKSSFTNKTTPVVHTPSTTRGGSLEVLLNM